jgi:hypothetical protein
VGSDVFDECQPARDKARFVLLHKANGFDNIKNENRPMSPYGNRERLFKLLTNLHQRNLATLFLPAAWHS